MSYQWRKSDITVVSQFLTEEQGDNQRVIERLLSLNAALDPADIAKAIEIVRMQRAFDRGKVTLNQLKMCQADFQNSLR